MANKMNFKVGDKVRLIHFPKFHPLYMAIGTIVAIDDELTVYNYDVEIDGVIRYISHSEMELVDDKNAN